LLVKARSSVSSGTLEVREEIPNRPPVITSEPVVDASVALLFELIDVPVGDSPAAVAQAQERQRQTALLITAISAGLGYADATDSYPPTSILESGITGRVLISGLNVFGKHALAVFGSPT
jgi:hypothetical protein